MGVFLNKIALIAALLIAVFFGYRLAVLLFVILLPFLIAHLLSRWIAPFARKIQIPWVRKVFTIFALLFLLALLGLAFYGIGTLIVIGLKRFADQTPKYIEELTLYIDRVVRSLERPMIFSGQEVDLVSLISDAIRNLLGNLASAARSTFTLLVDVVTFLPQLLLASIIVLLSAYFMVVEDRDLSVLGRPLLQRIRLRHPAFVIFRRQVLHVIWGYLKAQFILMGVTFLLSTLGLLFLRIPYAPLIALVIAIVDFVPLLGPAVIYVPWILSYMILGNSQLAVFLFLLYLLVTLARQLLQPQILSIQIGLDPLLTLLSLYAGLRLMGVIGIIIGPLVVISVRAFMESDLDIRSIIEKL